MAAPAAPRPAAPRPSKKLTDALATQGLRYAPGWVARFLAAARAVRRVGGLLLLAGSTGTGKSAIVRGAGRLLAGGGCAEIPVRPEWLQAADLLGYVDPIRGLFSASAFVSAVRRAATTHRPGPTVPPFFVLLDEMNLARIESYGADLLSVLELPTDDPDRALQLYPPEVNEVWLAELARLRASGSDDSQAAHRRAELEAFYARAPRPESAHRLPLPPNLTIVGTLNTDQHTSALSPKVLDRSFVLQSEPLTAAAVFDVPVRTDAELEPIELPVEPEDIGPAVWDEYPVVRAQLEWLVDLWATFGFPPSRRMVRNARAYLAYAGVSDDGGEGGGNELTADLLHLFLIPRIVLPIDRALDLTERLLTWLKPRLAEDHPVHREVVDLRERARAGHYGDVRGLR